MGTNYYWFKEEPDEKEDVSAGLHIGKNSCGWVFNFEAHSHPKLKMLQDYKEFLKEGFIYNEYGDDISYDEFLSILEYSKEPFNGRPPYILVDPDYPHEPYEYEDEGFAFSEGDFS